jgi:hypothetical protein
MIIFHSSYRVFQNHATSVKNVVIFFPSKDGRILDILFARVLCLLSSRRRIGIPEMEFLDINLTKESSLLLHACSQSLLQKIRETRKLESIHE